MDVKDGEGVKDRRLNLRRRSSMGEVVLFSKGARIALLIDYFKLSRAVCDVFFCRRSKR